MYLIFDLHRFYICLFFFLLKSLKLQLKGVFLSVKVFLNVSNNNCIYCILKNRNLRIMKGLKNSNFLKHICLISNKSNKRISFVKLIYVNLIYYNQIINLVLVYTQICALTKVTYNIVIKISLNLSTCLYSSYNIRKIQ